MSQTTEDLKKQYEDALRRNDRILARTLWERLAFAILADDMEWMTEIAAEEIEV